MGKERGISMPPHLVPVAHAVMDERIDKLLVTIGPGSGKALSPETLILTRDGWQPIGKVCVGQEVLTPDGQTWAKIRAVLPQPHDYLFKVTFADGRVIRAHRKHLWRCYSDISVVNKWELLETEKIATCLADGAGCFIPMAKLDPKRISEHSMLAIVSIERETRLSPSVCINIDHPDGLFIAENWVVTHNSYLLSQVAPAFKIGQEPSLTTLGISAGEGLIQGFQNAVKEWIADSARWKLAFPGVEPDRDAGWSTVRGLFVTGRSAGNSDPNYAAFGIDSSKLTGVHARSINLDDIHDKVNAKSSESCLAIRQIYYNTILGRADPQGCKFVAAGRRWHQDDLYGHLADSGDWVHMNLPAIREADKSRPSEPTQLYWDITIPIGMSCCFNDY